MKPRVCVQFKEIQKAYEVLSDKDKRETYDRYGEEAALQGGGASSPANDLFGSLFGGRGRPSGPQRGEDTMFPLRVDLEDLYTGVTKKLKLTKRIICTACGGKGGKSVQACSGCKGKGVRVIIRQLGPGMIQQMQTACPECKGQGETMAVKDRCKDCEGEKTVAREKILDVPIERGMRHGDKIKFRGEGDELVCRFLSLCPSLFLSLSLCISIYPFRIMMAESSCVCLLNAFLVLGVLLAAWSRTW